MIESGIYTGVASTITSIDFQFPYQPRLAISGDFNLFSSGYNGGGVYMASGLYQTNSFLFPIYVGSAEDFKERVDTHYRRLWKGKHENLVFQNSWSKYGQDNFVWFLLEETKPETQFQREQWYLDNLRPFADEGRGFNIAKDTFCAMKGRFHSQETKDKISKKATGREVSEKTREKLKKKMESIKFRFWKNFVVFDPNGNLIEGNCLTSFCEQRGFNKGSFSELLNGKRKKYKGWYTSKEARDKESANSKPFKFTNELGEVIEGVNLRQFCKERGLNVGHMNEVRKGDRKSCQGWRKSNQATDDVSH